MQQTCKPPWEVSQQQVVSQIKFPQDTGTLIQVAGIILPTFVINVTYILTELVTSEQ
eukprot:CAMPEP_0116999716 /NCGR_PEP_ID=MMETSP0472-20121206/2325_1 /TAXON_ID=693140 ORGANISM="Tiarina fusus, Strain LIS" /NCGR_SAMPLE_ID=MMETSP0472 /ASSEMBLY_ACC=CAM_ASM_000603 /LENGTH=56 /DNA_ID=CAMNT_0004699221 /DNA_START=172 /DNA_END=342 /DNA_ORIENTATION=+